MKSIFLYTKNQIPLNLQKINACLYYDNKNDTFYRLNIMPQCTVFVSQDVEQRQMMTLTKYDPMFFMINLLYNQKKVNISQLGSYFQKRNWQLISTQDKTTGKTFCCYNRQKVFNFLQKKVDLMENYIDQKNPLDRLKLLKIDIKTISSDTISLLKNQINPDLVQQFVKERYNHNQNRKMAPQQEQPEALKPKPQGKNKKPLQAKEPQIPKNQKTLAGFFSAKK